MYVDVFMKVEDCEGRVLYVQVIVQYFLEPSKAHWLLYVPPGLTSRNSTFCPHNVFMFYNNNNIYLTAIGL